MTEADLKPSFATRVEAAIVAIPMAALMKAYKGVKKQIERERFPDRRKRLKQIKRQLKDIIESN